MKKPTVDYSGLRLTNLTDPRFSHTLLLLGWVGYFLVYFLTELLIPAERCIPVHCGLDDLIPFCEFFILPYVGWYGLVFGSLLYYLLYNVENFKRLQTFIMVTQAVALTIYIVLPTRQDLRPTEFVRDNFCVDIIRELYAFDTNTGVCPSLHCAYSIGIASAFLKDKEVAKWVRWLIAAFCALVCVSTTFVKQHSAVDFFAALPLCLLAEWIAFGSWWKEKLKIKKIA